MINRSLSMLLATVVIPLAAAAVSGRHQTQEQPGRQPEVNRVVRSCAVPRAGGARCHALQAVLRGVPIRSNQPQGYGPADLQAAYHLSAAATTRGRNSVVAVVDAYDNPNAEADLAVYRKRYGLPACTSATGCFRKVAQDGSTHYPRTNSGWSQEISLDLDVVSATCPRCRILLVEADSESFADLGAAVNRAATMGASVISNSYGGSDAPDSRFGHYYNHPGVAVVASTGDDGYGVQYPASSRFVTAVGGTTLRRASTSRGWSETAWSGSGSGCSTQNERLVGQQGVRTGCSGRGVADVSANADPETGISVYDSFSHDGFSKWLVFGGTSAAAPLVAGVYGLAGNTAAITNNRPYYFRGQFFDVTSGSNGSCATKVLCRADTGWDGPTGIGTPNGIGGF